MKDTLIRLLIISNIALLIVAAAPKKSSVLTVSQLDIVDSKGVVRARLAGNLPETYANGKAVGRGAAGMLLYDASGTERGGYVTFANDHVALTLDGKKEMTGIFVAGPAGGAALTLRLGGQMVELRVDPDDGPSIHALRDNKVVFHTPQPIGFENGSTCAEMRDIMKRKGRDYALDVCRRRISEEACQVCVGAQ